MTCTRLIYDRRLKRNLRNLTAYILNLRLALDVHVAWWPSASKVGLTGFKFEPTTLYSLLTKDPLDIY